MNESCVKIYDQDYYNTRNIVYSFFPMVPELLTLSLEEGFKTKTVFNVFTKNLTSPYKAQRIVLIQDEITIKESEAPQPFPTISLEDFVGKHLSTDEQRLMWGDFKKELWQEVVNGKISKIKYYRIVHKLTQKELAKKLSMKQPNIARLEKVGYRPDLLTLEKLGKVFQIDHRELL